MRQACPVNSLQLRKTLSPRHVNRNCILSYVVSRGPQCFHIQLIPLYRVKKKVFQSVQSIVFHPTTQVLRHVC